MDKIRLRYKQIEALGCIDCPNFLLESGEEGSCIGPLCPLAEHFKKTLGWFNV